MKFRILFCLISKYSFILSKYKYRFLKILLIYKYDRKNKDTHSNDFKNVTNTSSFVYIFYVYK